MSENVTVRAGVAWHMSSQLQVQLGAFHSGQSASAPMIGLDQIVPRTVPYGGRRRNRVFISRGNTFFFVRELL